MIAIVSAAFSNPALANTGKVDFTIGNVTVTGSDGRGQPLTKGAEVKSGDKIVSSVDGRAQIRFSDGAYVSLQPNTEFDVKEYRYSGKTDGTESALFGLFKGAMRTVTGLVGRANKSRYRIVTSTATIGIRGTGGLIAIGADGSTLVTGTSGIWTLSNKGGTIDIPAGSAGIAGANVNVPPKPADGIPVVPPPQDAQQALPPLPRTIVEGDVVNSLGGQASLGGTGFLISGPGYAVGDVGPAAPATTVPSTAVFDTSGRLTEFTIAGASPTVIALSGTHNEFGTDGVLAWDRWTGNVLTIPTVGTPTTQTLTSNQGLHTVVGLPTPAASMPIGVTYTYNMIGATHPTLADGSVAPGVLNSASLVGNFGTTTVNVNLSATAGGSTFTGTATGTIGGSTFSATGTANATTGVGATIGCSGSCGLNVNGFFAGTGATHAGIVYQIGVAILPNFTPSTLSGAAALGR
ncbi:MAG TPA: FecR family protein [Burkholderiales bacterium]|nr:FecR family protein [Burkholderiales bacterium]